MVVPRQAVPAYDERFRGSLTPRVRCLSCLRFRVSGFGFGVRVWGLGVWGLGFMCIYVGQRHREALEQAISQAKCFSLVALWYPLPFFVVLDSLVKQPQNGCPY